jgi:hypothetical protein
MRLPVALAAAASLAALAVPNAAQALTWNWSFATFDASQFASGTFTTAGVTPISGTTYQITGISGTYNRGGTSYQIVDLKTDEVNQFQWNGTPLSPISTDNFSPIGFNLTGNYVTIDYRDTLVFGYNPVTTQFTTFAGSDAAISSSLLAPVIPPSAAVPGPLPLMGAGAAFVWSRRLRRRVKSGSLKATPLSTTTAIHSVLPL